MTPGDPPFSGVKLAIAAGTVVCKRRWRLGVAMVVISGAPVFWVDALAQAPATTNPSSSATYMGSVAPLLRERCTACHQPGQAAPFSLVSYEDVRPRARDIARAVSLRSMPPWKPEHGFGDFVGARRLNDEEMAVVRRWADQGFPRGEGADSPPPTPDAAGWQLGSPDLVLSMPEPYILPAGTSDAFRTFVIAIPISERRYVRALEFLPGNAKVVHHANIKIDSTSASRRWDEEEPGPGYAGGGSRTAVFPDGHFLGWTPGQSPRVSLPGMAWRLDPGSDLVIEVHLMPGASPESVRFSVGFSFTDEIPGRDPYMIRLGRQDIDIAAGESAYVNQDSFVLPIDAHALAVQAHAHYLAREVKAWAELPNGIRTDLLYIKDWDFHWQDVYTYSVPVALPKGTTIRMRYVYDNTGGNRRNPHKPPTRVTFGQTSTSEMGSFWLQLLPDVPADVAVLDESFAPKLLRDDIAGNEKWLEVEPRNAQLHAELAACYVESGRFDEAISHLTEAVRIDPTAGRHYDRGLVLLQRETFDEAAASFDRALALRPNYPDAVLNLGVIAHVQGEFDRAIELYRRAMELGLETVDVHYNLARALNSKGEHARAAASYRDAIRLAPKDAEARRGLGQSLVGLSRTREAIAEYRIALAVDPNLVPALVELSLVLATGEPADLRDASEAVRLAERAAEVTAGKEAPVLDVLAIAHFARGDVTRAIQAAESAIALATASGNAALAAEILLRLDFYRRVQP